MRHRKVWSVVAAGVASTMLLASCSGSPSGDGDTVTLQMVESLTNPIRTELLRDLLDEFEADRPGVKVELISPPTEQADNKIQQMLQSGTGVDILEVRDLTVGPFSTNGWLYDMSGDLTSWQGWDQLTAQAQYATKPADNAYFIPYGFYGLSLFYRTDLVADAGFDGPPATWDDVLQQSKAIQDGGDGHYGFAFRGGKNGVFPAVAAISAYVAADIDTTNAYKLQNGDSIFSDPRSLEAMEMFLKLFEEGSPPSSIAWGYPEMVEGFTNGSTAFLLQDPEVIAAVQESVTVTDEQWNTAPLPTGPEGKAFQALATAGWGVAEASEHKEEAVDLVTFLATGEAPVRFAEGNSMVPIIEGADQSEFFKIGPWESYLFMSSEPEVYILGEQPRGASWWLEWNEKADAELQEVLLGQRTLEDLLTSWDTYWVEKWATE